MHVYKNAYVVIAFLAVFLFATVSAFYCEFPDNPKNGYVFYDSLEIGTVLQIGCDDGYRLQQTDPVYCTSNGTWSVEEVICDDILCPLIDEKNTFNIVYEGDRKLGSYATYSCKDESKDIHGNKFVFCEKNGDWTQINPECKNDICPPIETNDTFNIEYTREKRVFSYASFSCKDDRKVISGNKRVQCLKSAEWGYPFPECIDYLCPLIDENDIITVDYSDGRKINSIATYHCKDLNQNISGALFVTCQPNRQWSDVEPECKDILCPLIDEKDTFNIVYSDGRKINSTATFNCKGDNNEIEGVRFTTCLPSGEWTYHNPECIDILCPPIEEKDAFTIVYSDGRNINSTATFNCKGYNKEIEGIRFTTCLSSGEWTYHNPECIDIRCPMIDEKDKFSIVYSGDRKIKSTVTFYCKDVKEKIVGVRFATCQPSGEWTFHNPECRDIPCPLIDTKATFTTVYSDGTKINSTATFNCKDVNKKIAGVRFTTCLPSGEWTYHNPECRDILCPVIDEKDKFSIVYNGGRKIKSTVTFYCNDVKEKIVGVRFATCQPSGEWTFHNPECKVAVCAVKDFSEYGPKNMLLDVKGMEVDFVPDGSELALLCKGNLILRGNKIAMCGKGGKWIYGRAQCVIPQTVSHMRGMKEDNQRVRQAWTLLYPALSKSSWDRWVRDSTTSERPPGVHQYYLPRRKIIQSRHSASRSAVGLRQPWETGNRC